MELQTRLKFSKAEDQIDYDSKILLLGSCFAENMGEQMQLVQFQNLQNPFGVIFNPVSLNRLISRAVNRDHFTEEDVFEYNGYWRSYETHSLLNSPTKKDLLELLNRKLEDLATYLSYASHIILTFGTAWVYRLKSSRDIVANCHKIPQKEFSKHLLSVDEASDAISSIFSTILRSNKAAQIICTVSPVRHLKDGFVENSLSKAHLITGVHRSMKSSQNSFYFPAYELVMDELRDYRFYSEDMLHPNATAIKVIWDRFSEVWIDAETKDLQKEIRSINNGLAHRPFNPNSEEHQRFLDDLQQRINILQQKIPHLKFR